MKEVQVRLVVPCAAILTSLTFSSFPIPLQNLSTSMFLKRSKGLKLKDKFYALMKYNTVRYVTNYDNKRVKERK